MATTPSVKSEYHLDPVEGQRYVMTKPGGTTDSSGNPAGNVTGEAKTLPGSVWAYGNWWAFQTHIVALTTNASISDNTVLDTLLDASTFNYFNFECTAGTIDVYITLDGANWFLAPVTSTTAAGVVTANDIDLVATERGVLEGKFAGVQVLQKGTTISNFRGFYGNK